MSEDCGRTLDSKEKHTASDTHEVAEQMITLENTFAWYVFSIGGVEGSSNLRRVFMYVSIASSS